MVEFFDAFATDEERTSYGEAAIRGRSSRGRTRGASESSELRLRLTQSALKGT